MASDEAVVYAACIQAAMARAISFPDAYPEHDEAITKSAARMYELQREGTNLRPFSLVGPARTAVKES